MRPPFPYYGGKARAAAAVWRRFGRLDTYVEPFAGSLAVLLASPSPARRETVGDTHAAVCNFWRAVKADPDAVARHAVWPTSHHDLTARHRWLVRHFADASGRYAEDPDHYDAKAAGWWCWGMSLWIGGNFCDYEGRREQPSDQTPHMSDVGAGSGVAAQRAPDKSPQTSKWGVSGIGAQRRLDQIPHMKTPGQGSGMGIAAQRLDGMPNVNHLGGGRGAEAEHLAAVTRWMQTLADRLFRVTVLNRPWTSLVTPAVLGLTAEAARRGNAVGVLLDPPYRTDRRSQSLYASDAEGTSDDAAVQSYEWAVAHGEAVRIAYCCHEGDFPVPDGWTCETRAFRQRTRGAAARRDAIMFSPACSTSGMQDALF